MTRKATNKGNRQEDQASDNSAKFESILNNPNITSDIFDDRTHSDHPPHHYSSGRGQTNNWSSPPKHQSETRSGKRAANNRMPQLPATPLRPTLRNGKNNKTRQ